MLDTPRHAHRHAAVNLHVVLCRSLLGDSLAARRKSGRASLGRLQAAYRSEIPRRRALRGAARSKTERARSEVERSGGSAKPRQNSNWSPFNVNMEWQAPFSEGHVEAEAPGFPDTPPCGTAVRRDLDPGGLFGHLTLERRTARRNRIERAAACPASPGLYRRRRGNRFAGPSPASGRCAHRSAFAGDPSVFRGAAVRSRQPAHLHEAEPGAHERRGPALRCADAGGRVIAPARQASWLRPWAATSFSHRALSFWAWASWSREDKRTSG